MTENVLGQTYTCLYFQSIWDHRKSNWKNKKSYFALTNFLYTVGSAERLHMFSPCTKKSVCENSAEFIVSDTVAVILNRTAIQPIGLEGHM